MANVFTGGVAFSTDGKLLAFALEHNDTYKQIALLDVQDILALAKLANRYDEAFRETARDLDASQNGPHNQVNSSVAIEAEIVQSESK